MVDIVVATGATVVDMDFFEALGFRHYRGSPGADDAGLRDLYIDRIYDTYIDEDELQQCDRAIQEIADGLEPGPYSSRAFIGAMGRWLEAHPARTVKRDSLVRCAHEFGVPVFCPAFSDSSAGFGLVAHQAGRPDAHVNLDSVRDLRELTELKIRAKDTGLLMIGGGSPKNFAQDTVVCAELLGHDVPMHKYSIQITVADVRDGACSSSTLKEAMSWGKVNAATEQMVFSEATLALPLLASYGYHNGSWKKRRRRELARLLDGA
jgi:deoxyhypusine synthase